MPNNHPTGFPNLDTRTLQGGDKHLPTDLAADRTLLALAFQQRHQRDVDAWMAVAERHGWLTDLAQPQPNRPAYATIEVPCISRRWGLARRFIDGGMTAGIRVATILARAWTAYTDVGRVQRALGIADSESMWATALTADGDVSAETLGPSPTTSRIDCRRDEPDAMRTELKHRLMVHDPPYGTERVNNGLRSNQPAGTKPNSPHSPR